MDVNCTTAGQEHGRFKSLLSLQGIFSRYLLLHDTLSLQEEKWCFTNGCVL